ncbi:uncharacterized [Tachysurus ichikawai]
MAITCSDFTCTSTVKKLARSLHTTHNHVSYASSSLFSSCHGAVSVRAECLSKAQATLSIWPHRSAISRVLLGSKSSKSLVRPEALSSTAARQR